MMKKLKAVFILFFSIVLYGQNIQIKDIDRVNIFNSLNMDLATSKLCQSFLSDKNVYEERRNKSSYTTRDKKTDYSCHICAESISIPYIEPLEEFLERYLKDRRIKQNRTNAFKIRSVREEIDQKYRQEYEQMVDSIDTENLTFYKYDLVQGYSFESNELSISLWPPKIKNFKIPLLYEHGINSSGKFVNNASGYLAWLTIPMSEQRAKEIYDKYADHHSPNPPFAVSTKVIYALRLGEELNEKPRYFQVILKRIEFYLPDDINISRIRSKINSKTFESENKIYEINFQDKIYYNEDGFAYQKIESEE